MSRPVLFALSGMILLLSALAAPAEAIPAFSRKHDLSCTACHTKPPRLNAFGEAFHMAGFQVPSVEEGETKEKRKIGRIFSETGFLNIFSLRAHGNFMEAFGGGEPSEINLAFPLETELYLAGTLTSEVGYFFELEHTGREIEGKSDGSFEARSRFGLGKEFFLMVDLGKFLGADHGGYHASGRGPMRMGPMLMAGKIDPSTNFSYPTNRQFILNIPGRVGADAVTRFTLAPYAFAVKFFGVRKAGGEAVEVTEESLYNTAGGFGADAHLMVERLMLQAGVLQGLESDVSDADQQKDPYVMLRVNFGGEKYVSGSLSGLIYWGNDTARVPRPAPSALTDPVDWLRYGFAANVKYRLLDLYGAFLWDKVRDLPAQTAAVFDDEAFGFTVEGDYLATQGLLLSLRYDHLDAGGFLSQRADAKALTLQARYYLRDNLSFFLRDTYNAENVSANALQNYRHMTALGVDLDF